MFNFGPKMHELWWVVIFATSHTVGWKQMDKFYVLEFAAKLLYLAALLLPYRLLELLIPIGPSF